MPEISLMYLWRKVEILRGQDEKEAEMEVIVNFLHILGLKNIYCYFLIEIELRQTTLKLSGSHY